MKHLLVLLFIITFGNSETFFNGNCIDSYFTDDEATIYYYKSDSPNTLRSTAESKAKIDELRTNINRFYYDENSGNCIAHMYDENTQLLMSLTGLICGTLLASVILFKVT